MPRLEFKPELGRKAAQRMLASLRIFSAWTLCLSMAFLAASPSRAFKQNHTDNPTPGAGPVLAWNGATLPVRFQINPTPPTGIASGQRWQAALKRSLQTWIVLPTSDLTACCTGLTTSQSFSSGDANVCWAMNTGWDGGSMVLASTRYDFVLATGELTDADTKFNGEQATWTDSYTAERAAVGGDTDFDLQSVATHEFGHAFGFSHSLDNTTVNVGDPDYDDNGTVGVFGDDQINGANQNTMDPVTIAGETFQRSLTAADDILAMDATYGSAAITLARPAAFLTEPDGVGDAPAGGSYTIQWLSEYEGATTPTVSFYYTANPTDAVVSSLAGATLIAANITSPKNGSLSSYTWNFLNVPAGSYYVIAVITADGKTEKDVSPGQVTVAPAALTLTTPTAAGITLIPYNTYAVTWTQNGSSQGAVKIELSLDNGVNYSTVIALAAPNTGSYAFSVPDPPVHLLQPAPQTQCKIRIAYAGNAAINSTSANPFTIAANTNSLDLTSPTGGELYAGGQTVNITFNASGADVGNDFALYWTNNNGATWVEINGGVNIPGPNPRTYAWVVPGQPGGLNRVQVFSLNASQYFDFSGSPFTIQLAASRTFSAYPDHLIFDVIVGAGNPPSQNLNFRNAGLGLLTNCSIAVTGDPSVTVTPNSFITVGPSPDLATVSVGLVNGYASPGTANASLVFTTAASNAINEGYAIPVTIRIHAAGGVAPLTYTPATLTFTADPSALAPGSQASLIVNPNANVDTQVDAYPDDLDVIVKPGRFNLAAGDAVAGGADEQSLTVLADTVGLPAGAQKTAHIFTDATNIGTGFITVNIQVSGKTKGKKKSGCAIDSQFSPPSSAPLAPWLLLSVLALLVSLRQRRVFA